MKPQVPAYMQKKVGLGRRRSGSINGTLCRHILLLQHNKCPVYSCYTVGAECRVSRLELSPEASTCQPTSGSCGRKQGLPLLKRARALLCDPVPFPRSSQPQTPLVADHAASQPQARTDRANCRRSLKPSTVSCPKQQSRTGRAGIWKRAGQATS